jgi:hypothetical protein
MKQYPHSISITPQPALKQDAEGNVYTSTDGTAVVMDCRVEPSHNNGTISGVDGKQVAYTFVVYMPMTVLEFTPGDKVTVTLENGSQYNGRVKRQSNGQLNTRLWV